MGKLRDFLPALMYGNRIYPEDLAGMIGLPYVGSVFYIDPTNGNDTTNGGKSQNDALKTLRTAEDKTTDNKHDVIILVPAEVASGSGTAETALITWDKDNTHLVGSCAPVLLSHRARILWDTDSVDPCFTISGQGNTFKNVQIATFKDSNDVLINLTGQRNSFLNCHIAAMGTATAGDDATGRCIDIVGGSENYFGHCYIGLDTIMRSAANAEIEFRSGATRNVFEDCYIMSIADSATHLWVKAASSGGIDRFVVFKDTLFYNAIGSTGTTMTVGMDLHASVGGLVLLTGTTMMVGATDWADDFTNVYTGGVVPTAATSGLMIAAA